jgi:general secretion pathway protein F
MRVQLQVVRGRATPQSIELDASTLEEARQQALGQGYAVLSLWPAQATLRHWLGAHQEPMVSSADVAVFVEQLRDLLGAGLSVIEALTTLQHAVDARRRAPLDTLIQRLRGGERLSQARKRSINRALAPMAVR